MSHFLTIVALEDMADLETILEPFDQETEDPAYLEFINVEAECRERFQNHSKDYRSFAEYMDKFEGYPYEEAEKAFGYYHNPQGQWDWYTIGGRWPYPFLVKEDTPMQIPPQLSPFDQQEPPKSPAGYRLVAGAPKKYIEWEWMKKIAVAKHSAGYQYLKTCYQKGIEPKGCISSLTPEGIEGWGKMLFYKEESLENYLKRNCASSEDRYFPSAYAFVHQDSGWHARGQMGYFGMSSDDVSLRDWHTEMLQLLDKTPDHYLLVAVDCHC